MGPGTVFNHPFSNEVRDRHVMTAFGQPKIPLSFWTIAMPANQMPQCVIPMGAIYITYNFLYLMDGICGTAYAVPVCCKVIDCFPRWMIFRFINRSLHFGMKGHPRY